MITYDIWGNAKVLDDNSAGSKKEIAEALEYMLPIFVACEVVIPNVKIQKRKA